MDERASLVNGECKCPPAEYLFGGNQHCSSCRVPGCIKCSPVDTNLCVSCHSGDHTLSLKEGKCVCRNPSYLPDQFGWCNKCNVEGCLSCRTENKCYVCKDNKATVSTEGKCKCPQDYLLNSEGQCVSLKVQSMGGSGSNGNSKIGDIELGVEVGIGIILIVATLLAVGICIIKLRKNRDT